MTVNANNYELNNSDKCRYNGQEAVVKSTHGSYATIELEDGRQISIPKESLHSSDIYSFYDKIIESNNKRIEARSEKVNEYEKLTALMKTVYKENIEIKENLLDEFGNIENMSLDKKNEFNQAIKTIGNCKTKITAYGNRIFGLLLSNLLDAVDNMKFTH